MNLKKLKLAIIGLGYVGLPLAVEFAKKRKVIGYDLNSTRIKELNSGFGGILGVFWGSGARENIFGDKFLHIFKILFESNKNTNKFIQNYKKHK